MRRFLAFLIFILTAVPSWSAVVPITENLANYTLSYSGCDSWGGLVGVSESPPAYPFYIKNSSQFIYWVEGDGCAQLRKRIYTRQSLPSHCFNNTLDAGECLLDTGDGCNGTCPVVNCTSWTYSDWGSCQQNDTQTRTILTSSPAGCTGGSPVLSQSCDYEPATCQNNTKDGAETGVDCGGSCNASSCTAYCPTGYNYIAEIDMCLKETAPDKFGNCPYQFAIHDPGDPAAQCQHFAAPEYASPTDQPDQSVFGALPQGWSGGSYVIATNVQPSSTVDNGNGTSTTTETSTVTSGSGTGATSTTVTRIFTTNNTTGAVISDQTTSTQATAPEEETGNYNYNVSDTPSDGTLPLGIVPDKENFGGFLNDAVSSNAGSTIISGSGIQTSSPVCSISAPVFGSNFTLDFCNQQITDFLELLGTFLVGFAYLIALFIVFA